ncbi:helix-turn-helix domain-containing protein [Altererythrobacter aquiaggeris]|uniref:helix-turn-helix domain-containing protein n=1 Tax=Aestuarierythrobacter aquiaggeris TaxID=1898396 RepID=UPI0030163FF9
MPDSLLSVDEAKRQLSVGTTLIYSMMKSGELRRVKLGGKTLIAQSDIQAFIAKKLEEAAAA